MDAAGEPHSIVSRLLLVAAAERTASQTRIPPLRIESPCEPLSLHQILHLSVRSDSFKTVMLDLPLANSIRIDEALVMSVARRPCLGSGGSRENPIFPVISNSSSNLNY